MARHILSLVALIAFAAVTDAQPYTQPRPLPLSPGVQRGSPFGPGMPSSSGTLPLSPGVQRGSPFGPGMPSAVGVSGRGGLNVGVTRSFGPGYGIGFPIFPGYGFGYGFGGYGGGFVENNFYIPGSLPTPAAPAAPAPATIVLANEFPATLTLQFPAAAEVWLAGDRVKGDAAEEVAVTSPILKPGQTYTFEVKARWKSGGKNYETVRAVTLGPGDRSRLIVVSGTEVRE